MQSRSLLMNEIGVNKVTGLGASTSTADTATKGYADHPTPPPARVELTTLFGSLFFNSIEECLEYRAEPLWRKIFGRTKYQRRLCAEAGREE